MNRCGLFQLVLFAFLSTFALASSIFAAESGYKFSINGKPVTPQHYSLNGDPSVYMPGDIVCIGAREFGYGGLFIKLGEAKEYHFVKPAAQTGRIKATGSVSRTPVSDGRIFLELPDGGRKVVAVLVTWTFEDEVGGSDQQPQNQSRRDGGKPASRKITVNPLDDMSPEEIHDLWGVCLADWVEGLEQKLAHVNMDRVCITLNDFAGVDRKSPFGGSSLPPIPPKVRHLVIDEAMSPGISDFSRLSQFCDLVFLKVESTAREPLNAGLIANNTSLRHLDVSGCTILNYAKLAALSDLRALNISWCQDVENIDFVGNMHHLRTLLMSRTRVSSLSPLDGSDSIREIHAGATGVRVLPKGHLGSLKAINLVSSKVDTRMVAQFRTDHPTCAVQYGWEDSLREVIQGATRLRVRSGGTCHRIVEWEKTLAEITDAAEISRFVSGIRIDESRSGGACMCCGNPTFEFYAGERLLAMVGYHHGERLLAMVGYHHGERLRWADGEWMGDGELTGSSASFLNSWLLQHGVEGPRREVEAGQKRRAEEERIAKRYAELIPPETLKAVSDAESSTEISWSNDTSGKKRRELMGEAFRKHEKDATASVELYLRVLGVRANGPWNAYYSVYDSVMVESVLPRFKGPELAQGTIRAMMDEEAVYGVARWLLGVDGWRNLDPVDREKLLPPLAKRSLQSEFSETRKKTMTSLLLINSGWATALLRDMLSRSAESAETPTKRTSSGWRIDLGDGDQLWSGEYSDAAWAAFCLAKLGDLQSQSAIERLTAEARGKDKDLLDKAIQLLRETRNKAPAGKE